MTRFSTTPPTSEGKPPASLFVCTIALIFAVGCADQLPSDPLPAEPPAGISRSIQGIDQDHYIVSLDSSVDASTTARALGRAHGGEVGYVYQRALHGFSIRIPEAAVNALERNPHVLSVEPVGVRHLTGVQSSPPWGLDRIDQTSLPLNQSYRYAGTGWNYTAYVFDTGIRTTHIDFGGRASTVWTVADGAGGIDCHGHGTHVAGTIGGAAYGVAKEVKIAALRVFAAPACNSAYDSDIIAAIDWLIANRRLPAVANMSLGGSPSAALDGAVNRLIASGVAVVVSAGNDAVDACTQSPARVPAAVTVAASDWSDRRSSFSNWGPCVDIFAPGSSVTSAYHRSNTDFASLSGTSMAGPHVAGAIAYTQEPIAANGVNHVLGVPTLNAITDARAGSPNRLLNTNNLPVSCGRTPCLPNPIDSRLQAITIGGPYSAAEGAAVSFALSAASDPSLTYSWDFGDLTTGSGSAVTHTYADNDTYVVTLTATVAADPTQTRTLTTTAVVSNAAPQVDAGADVSITSGQTLNVNAVFADAGTLDSPWAYQIDWGDTSPPGSGSTFIQGSISAAKRYFAAGQYQVRVSVTDKDGGAGSDHLLLTVTRVPAPMDILPGDATNTIRLKGKPTELIAVAILGSSSLDAAAVDASSATLGNGTGTDAAVARDRKGVPLAAVSDVNGDGRPDKVVSFIKNDLIRFGDVTESTLQLVLRAALVDGTEIQGTDRVHVK